MALRHPRNLRLNPKWCVALSPVFLFASPSHTLDQVTFHDQAEEPDGCHVGTEGQGRRTGEEVAEHASARADQSE